MKPIPNDNLARFVVLFEGRSGSTFFIEALDSHPRIRAHKELLAEVKKKVERGKAEPEDQAECLRRLFVPGDHDYDAIGFKTKYKDILDPEGFARLIGEYDARVILLQRRNRIKLMVSLMNAVRLNAATGDWNLYSESDRQPMLHVDLEQFAGWLQRTEKANAAMNDYADRLERPMLRLCYEDLLMKPGPSFERICEFLGVPPAGMQAQCKKNTSDDLREVVENFEELKAAFAGTPYEEMFDEVLQPQA
ncbi:MAG: hypothetical protein HKN82_00320 [Akkermansiaceae bacterium]|nr:hypothetical protein [Akkermansiaceae bacterium]NNM29264.1 hypothetical protein [Akkermansiaceae bacterium]